MRHFTILILLFFSTAINLYAQNETVSTIKVRNKIIRLTKKLIKENLIYGKAVGFSASERPPYKAFKIFVDESTVSELIALTDNANPLIRGYAFWALTIRDRQKAIEQLDKFKNDEAWVNTNLRGCVPTPFQLKQFTEIIIGLTKDEMKSYYEK